ncbi:hypothetical protein GCM10010330_09280 [Streptomyces tendae]|nr:hypothetical protein GCM10010330_09280 [Streptomyces tendae]
MRGGLPAWGFFAPAAPSLPDPGGCRPQTPAFGLDGLVLKRRTGWRGLNGLVLKRRTGWRGLNGLVLERRTG